MNRRCINCSINTRRLCWIALENTENVTEDMFNILLSWTAPTQLTRENILCMECYGILRLASNGNAVPEPMLGYTNVCYGCGVSIRYGVRTHNVPLNCPERDVIIRWTSPHLVHHLTKVCYACWMAARRNVERLLQQNIQEQQQQHEEIDEAAHFIPVPPPLPENMQQQEREPEPDEAAHFIPVPPPLPENRQQREPEPKIISRTYKRAASTTRHCIFPDCENEERLLLPAAVKDMLLSRFKFFVPPCARVCSYHLQNNHWHQLDSNYNDFTGAQIDKLLAMMEKIALRTIDFSDINALPIHLCHYWLGMEASSFYELLSLVPSLHDEVPNATIALSIMLVKLRTGDSNERLSTLFNIPRSTLERYMNSARNCLTDEFVPLHLGLNHMSVQEVAQRNKIVPEGLFGNPELPNEIKPAITIFDATYIYLQSSSNYSFQKNTFSLHKHQNLVKPFMLVCCDGYILDSLGPYKAIINDASITNNEFRNPAGAMRTYFREGDIFILDKGFRDAIPNLQEYGFQAYMPESLLDGEHQLTTEQANRTRWITMCRWVVEVVHGMIKRDFRLLRLDFCNRAARHLMDDFRIACALINKFRPRIEDNPQAQEFLEIARSRVNMPNRLATFVENTHMNRLRAAFEAIDENHPHLNSFPRLTIQDLQRFALGSYQLKQARSYYGEHIRDNGSYLVEINNEIDDDLPLYLGQNNYLIRGRIKSRHVGGRTYFIYLLMSREENTLNSLNAIVGYCCSCLVGKRTVGCCAHVMTVVWYLSWGRYEDVSAPATFLDDIFDEYVYEDMFDENEEQ